MAVVSVAIVISFHLKSQPTSVEKRIALPVGLVFWLLSLACLISGFSNYVKTVRKYARRKALVQSGWKTQVVCELRFYAPEVCSFSWLILEDFYDRSLRYCSSLCPISGYECCLKSVI